MAKNSVKNDIDNGIGRSVGGNTTKIHMVVDSLGLPIYFELTGREVHDSKMAAQLISNSPQSEYVIADRGYDSNDIRKKVIAENSTPIIPRKNNSKVGNDDIDWYLYKLRHLIENTFARLKHFRGIATSYDKLKRNFQGMLLLACSFIWLPI